jgi:hypothetical protein
MRSFVASVPGVRSNPDPVRVCAQCASSARHLFIPFDSLRSACGQCTPALPYCRPTFDLVRLMQSFPLRAAAPTAFTTTNNSTSPSHRQPSTTTPCGRWMCSQRAAKGLFLGRSCEASKASVRSPYSRHRSSSTGVSPPTSQHRARRFAWFPLLVPCSDFQWLATPPACS